MERIEVACPCCVSREFLRLEAVCHWGAAGVARAMGVVAEVRRLRKVEALLLPPSPRLPIARHHSVPM